jgi:hypothetical protein
MATAPLGFSPTAQFLDTERRKALRRFRDSATFSKQAEYEQLGEVYDACRQLDWDGEGAEAIEQDTLRNAYMFIEALPDGYPLPTTISGEPDGHINLEWYRHRRRILSVSISPDGMLYWAALFGVEDPRGSCPFYGDIPETILYWIGRVWAK